MNRNTIEAEDSDTNFSARSFFDILSAKTDLIKENEEIVILFEITRILNPITLRNDISSTTFQARITIWKRIDTSDGNSNDFIELYKQEKPIIQGKVNINAIVDLIPSENESYYIEINDVNVAYCSIENQVLDSEFLFMVILNIT